MARAKKVGGLGKGLLAIIPEVPVEAQEDAGTGTEHLIALDQISVNPFQPRSVFDADKLQELCDSIKAHGVIQPILVREADEGYQLIAGERRVRAAKLAGLTEIPALVRSWTDHEVLEVAIIENIQRQDLDPVEEARAYKRLAEEFGQTQEQIAGKVSKSRSYVANSIRLLQLPEHVLGYLEAGTLTIGHVRPLLALTEADAISLADRLVAEKATVREAEQWTRDMQGMAQDGLGEADEVDEVLDAPVREDGVRRDTPLPMSAELLDIARILRERVNTKVEITQGQKGGKIIIDYYTQDDIEHILELLTGSREI